jgi:hypothetical protein
LGTAETAHGVAGRRRNSGDGSWVLQSTSSTTSGTGVILTFLRNSGAAPRRWSSGDDEERRRRRARVPAAARARAKEAARVWIGVLGGGGTLNSRERPLGVRATHKEACQRRTQAVAHRAQPSPGGTRAWGRG